MDKRYVVAEIEGYLHHNGAGLSVMVVDTAFNRRVVKIWRTEDYGGSIAMRRILVRQRARDYAEALNRGTPTPLDPIRRRGFRPTCPRCAILCEPGAVYCVECGCRLGLTA